jgi:hypothetical protein
MKKEVGMCFWPKPIMHPTKPINDASARMFIIIKPCGFCNQSFQCHDIIVINYKHTFHLFFLGAMLKDSNKCYVCKQKLHPNWWSSWGICGASEEVKELVEEMCVDDLQKDMAVDIIEAGRNNLDVRSNGHCKLMPIGIHKI